MNVPYVHHSEHGPRQTSRGIIIKDGNILLMERWRDGLHYFAVPGGGIENDETPELAAKREVKEETSVEVKVGRLVYELHDATGPHRHYFYLCEFISGEPHLPTDSEEAQLGPNNRFKPAWVPIGKLPELRFNYWDPIRILLIEDLKKGFPKKVKITAA